ncbi:MAG: hypothetical protein MJ179_01295 [Treponema sp.]|nr:hypothetical protein [Treponema sp.]
MELNFEQIFQNTNDLNPLKISFQKKGNYFLDFLGIIQKIAPGLKKSEYEDLLFNKLQLGKNTFDEVQYYQYATELSVIFHAFCLEHTTFNYEKVVRDDVDPKKGKQPECTLTTKENFTFNIEAKSPKPDSLSKTTNGNKVLYFVNVGRADSKIEANIFLEQMKKDLVAANPGLECFDIKNNDNKLKDYLYSAGEKFPTNKNNNEANILFVALNNVDEIQTYVNFLCNNQGLFTSNSFADKNKYSNVDIVIFTNSLYRHKNNEKINGSAWWLNDGFNFITFNPQTDFKNKESVFVYFCNKLSNFNKQIASYKIEASSDTDPSMLDAFRISAFVREQLEKKEGIFLF